MSASELALGALREDLHEIKNLQGDSPIVTELRNGKRMRARFWWISLAAVLLAAVTAAVFFYYMLVLRPATTQARNDQHDDTQHQISKLACGLVQFTPPGDPLGDNLRRQYDCPQYRRPSSRTSPHAATPSEAKPSSTITVHAAAPPSASPQTPGAAPTVAPRTVTRVETSHTVTRRAGSTVTRTAQPPAAPTSPSPTPLTCTLLRIGC